VFGPQFAVYTEALRFAGKTVLEQWVSFAIAGGAVRMVEATGLSTGVAARV
jgi:hypothetical protein